MIAVSPARIGRRMLFAGLAAAAGIGAVNASDMPVGEGALAAWAQFKDRFVRDDGRVVDNDNRGVSHSEGQGYGMAFAEHFADLATFERVLDWSVRNLARRDNALHAWRYIPNVPVPVSDTNNATDGDLFIAYALSRAGRRWGRPDFTTMASDIATDILRLLTRRVAGRTVLMPGLVGFDSIDTVVINPSYYAFFAFDELNLIAPSDIWGELTRDGISVLRDARFGRWKLPPDWLSISKSDGGMAPAPNHATRFSWDAVRVPLHLAWAGHGDCDALQSIAAFWDVTARSTMPAWIDLVSNEISPYPASRGLVAVRDLTLAAARYRVPGQPGQMALPANYYAAALMLLAELGNARSRVSNMPPVISSVTASRPYRLRT